MSTLDVATPLCNCDERSILDILWSCLGTLVLCTWVAVHPNLPKPNEPDFRVLMRRLKMMYWTMLAPELVLTYAVRQYLGARNIFKKYKSPERKWSMKHAYMLQMGGFHIYSKAYTGVLYAEKLDELLFTQKIEFPDVNESDIQDKSKTDGLSKMLLLTQTSWFVIQCAGRIIQGYSLAPLEVTTLAVTVCAFMLSIIWFNKPFDVRQPIILDGILSAHRTNVDEDNYSLSIAFGDNASTSDGTISELDISDAHYEQHSSFQGGGLHKVSTHARVEDVSEEYIDPLHLVECGGIFESDYYPSIAESGRKDRTVLNRVRKTITQMGRLYMSRISSLFRDHIGGIQSVFIRLRNRHSRFLRYNNTTYSRSIHSFCGFLKSLYIQIWAFRVARIAYRLVSLAGSRVCQLSSHLYRCIIGRQVIKCILLSVGVRDGKLDLDIDEFIHDPKRRIFTGFTIPVPHAIIFGLVHCIAWNSRFPSDMEQLLWRISSIALSAALIVSAVTWKLVIYDRVGTFVAVVFFKTPLIIYAVARYYLIVEAFIAFRDLSPSVLQSMNWSNFLPHI